MLPLYPVILAFTCVLYILYYAAKAKFQYWEKRKIPFLKPTPFLGNFSEFILLRKYAALVTQKLCQKFSKDPYFGVFYGTEPALVVQDPALIKQVLTKDFYYFSSREISKYTHNEVFTQNLFFTYGDRWKVIRQNLKPLFSSAKMKNMFHLIEKCSRVFESMLDDETRVSSIIELKSLMTKFTMDCVGSCAFGIDTNTMQKNTINNPFTNIGNLIFENTNFRGFKNIARAMWPFAFYGLRFKAFPKEIDTFFMDMLTRVFEGREYKPSNRNDFVDLVLNLKKNNHITGDSLSNMKTGEGKKVNLEVNDDLLAAQCIMFFAAGFETSSTTLSFTLYELAKNPGAQERAIREVDEYLLKRKNKLQYECITELPYLEACTEEALRLYPVLGLVTRELVEDYTLPSGQRLDKGLRVHVPVYHLHRHPDYFPDPDQYRPERFLPEERKNIQPYTFMPFGEGPRICIGMRFAKMQMMSGLVTILKKYRVELAEGMSRTVELDPRAIITQPIGFINLKLTPREGWKQRQFVSP